MSMMVNVVCPVCLGTGDNVDGVHGCGSCLMQGHIRVDRDVNGAVPSGFVEWVDADFGVIPANPLTLRSEVYARP